MRNVFLIAIFSGGGILRADNLYLVATVEHTAVLGAFSD